jgi:hypothetical protein
MKNEYTAPEVIEVGNADEVILEGGKRTGSTDVDLAVKPDSDLDD